MTLAVMLANDRDAFICDMAETYHILDYKALPVELLAVLASGLRENSRSKMSLVRAVYVAPEMILPQIVDRLALIFHAIVGDKNLPPMVTDMVFGEIKTEKPNRGFDSGEEFQREWNRISRSEKDG